MSVPRTIEWRPWLTQTILVGVFSGTCLGALMTAWRNRRFERAQLRRDALERMLSQFLAPVSMQLARSKRSSEAYHISYGDKGRSFPRETDAGGEPLGCFRCQMPIGCRPTSRIMPRH